MFTFVDTEERNVDLNDFIKNILNLPLKLNSSITTSIEFRQEFVTARLFRNATT